MVRSITSLLLPALLAFGLGTALSAQDQKLRGRPLVQVYNSEDYHGTERVWKVCQGESGWIWLLTPRVLHSYDGRRWREFALPVENGGHLCMAPLAGGGVVLGAEGDLASCAPDENGNLRYRSLLEAHPGIQESQGRTRLLQRIGDLYYFTDSLRFGRFRIDTRTGLAKDLEIWGPNEEGTKKRPPMFLFQKAGDEIWVEFLDKGLGHLGPEGPELVTGGDFFAKRPFIGVRELGSALLVATISQGLYLFENGEARPWSTEASTLCKSGNPSGLVRLDTGLYLLSTRRRGLVLFDAKGDVQLLLDTETGLPSNSVYSNPEPDDQGALWVPTGHGVARVQLDSDLTIFGRQDGLRGEIQDIHWFENRLHVLTNEGIFAAVGTAGQPGKVTFEALPNPRAPPRRLASIEGHLLVGTQLGLFSYDPQTRSYSELVHLSTRALETDRSGEWIFLGTNGSGLVRLHKSQQGWHIYQPEKPSLESCTQVLLDGEENAWAYLLDQRGRTKLRRYLRESGYREFEEMTPPGRKEQGEVALSDFYLYEEVVHIRVGDIHFRWDETKDRFVMIRAEKIPGLVEAGVASRPLNSKGRSRWFVRPDRTLSLYRRPPSGSAELLRPFLRVQDGNWSCWRIEGPEATLWAGNAAGILARCDSTKALRSPPIETPRFSLISNDGHNQIYGGYGPLTKALKQWSPEQNHFRFSWALPSFESQDKIRYRTRLVGLETGWTPWSPHAEREFLSLPPGSFEFEVEARDSRGRLCPRLRYPFRIRPPWYLSLWVVVGLLLTASLLLLALLSWRSRRVGMRVQRLETEVAQREAAERDLEESQHRYRSLVETTSDLVWEMDVDFCYVYASPRFEDQLGYKESELVGHSPFELIEEEDRDRVRAQLVYSKEAGTPFAGIQYTIREKTGRKRRIESNGVPIFDQGILLGFRGIDRDVTERQAAEAEKRELEDRLRQGQKLESLGRLAGGVAHDFNNILTAILGHAELVRDFCKPGVTMSDGLYGSVEEILRAGQQAADLTGRLLAFSRQQILRPRVVDPAEVLIGLERMLQRLIREDIEIVLDLSSDAGSILVDGGQLEQVIINLVVNAVDAMPEGGLLTLRTERVEVDRTHVTLHPGATEGSYVRISVTDTGHGMDEKTQHRIFEPFFTTKDPGKGTGLGLASTHGIVQQSGGHIHVSSQPDKGTTLELYFPIVAGESEEPQVTVHPQSIAGTESILVCDDDAAIRSVAERSLTAHGYRVRTAANAQEAQETLAASEGPLDLLITDLIMPGINGKELAEKIRQDHPGLPVLFASGYTADIILDQSALPPHTEFLPKPFTSQDLLQRVRQLLES